MEKKSASNEAQLRHIPEICFLKNKRKLKFRVVRASNEVYEVLDPLDTSDAYTSNDMLNCKNNLVCRQDILCLIYLEITQLHSMVHMDTANYL